MTKPQYLAALIFIGFILLTLFTHLADFFYNDTAPSLFYPLYTVDARASLSSIGSLAEVITSLFGIIITVVAIIVNLSANRYTQKMIDMFIKEKINIIILSLFSITSLYGIWIINLVHFTDKPMSYIPRIQVLSYLFLVSLSIILIVPYFYYVFQFLKPASIIAKIENQVRHLLEKAAKLKGKSGKNSYTENHIKPTIVENLDQLTEICKSSVKNADQSLALLALTTLKQILAFYLDRKENHLQEHIGELPFNSYWYSEIDDFFLGQNQPIIEDLTGQRIWFEYKILEDFESIFYYSFQIDSKIAYQTAINLTKITEKCIEYNDLILYQYIIRYFNTLLKKCIINADIQNTIYVFYQYYLTCEKLIDNCPREKGTEQKELLLNIAKYFKYYGQLGEQEGLDEILEYSAYFLRLANQKVFKRFIQHDMHFVEDALDIFLTVDDIIKRESNDKALLGVRQHQAILASYYMVHGDGDDADETNALVSKIVADMKDEHPSRRKEILDSILAIDRYKHFEIDNLGINPIFTRKQYRKNLKKFFGKFNGKVSNE